jgi:pimeloyl-ACP methyl ester carboxylesterase
MAKMQPNHMMLGSGIELSYAEGGDPRGLPILMLSGFTDSWRSFEPLAQKLPRNLRTIALSHRGHGMSDKPMDGYTIAAFAQDVIDAMDHLRIPRAVILGHCMGSLVAARLAMRAPERVLGLVLIGAMRTLKGNAAVEALWRDGVATMADPIDESFVREFQESTLARPVPRRFFEQVVSESMKMPAHAWRSTLRSLLDDDSNIKSHIHAPACIIWGDQDRLTLRAEQQALVSTIPDATLIVHEGAGHAPHWEDPAGIAADVVAWMSHMTTLAA